MNKAFPTEPQYNDQSPEIYHWRALDLQQTILTLLRLWLYSESLLSFPGNSLKELSVLFANTSSRRILSPAASVRLPHSTKQLWSRSPGASSPPKQGRLFNLILLTPSASFVPKGHCLSLNSDCRWPRHHPLSASSLHWLLLLSRFLLNSTASRLCRAPHQGLVLGSQLTSIPHVTLGVPAQSHFRNTLYRPMLISKLLSATQTFLLIAVYLITLLTGISSSLLSRHLKLTMTKYQLWPAPNTLKPADQIFSML